MSRSTLNSALIAAACAGIFILAEGAGAQAYESAMDACRKWTGQGAGMQYKCFDCIKPAGYGPNQHWVNICPEYNAYEGFIDPR